MADAFRSRVNYTGRPRNKGGRRRTRASMDRDALALDLWLQGMKYEDICTKVDPPWKNRTSAFDAVRRALADRQRTQMEAVDNFTAAVADCQRMIQACQKVIDGPPPVVTATGKVATDPDTGEVIRDVGAVQRAIDQQRKLREHLDRLQGNFAPTKQRVEVVTEDVVDAEIAKLAKELADAGRSPGIPELPGASPVE
jgi:hypothetical protein